jgi:hypothetical protein
MHTDLYAKTRYQAAAQADENMRRDEPWLWHFANVVTWGSRKIRPPFSTTGKY